MTTDLTALWHTNRRWRAWMDANTKFVTPADDLDTLRYARIEAVSEAKLEYLQLSLAEIHANKAADIEMRERLPGHARNNGRDHTVESELADTAMLLLTALPNAPVVNGPLPNLGVLGADKLLDEICRHIPNVIFRHEDGDENLRLLWRLMATVTLYYIVAYPGLDLAAELDRCWRRLAEKHGWPALMQFWTSTGHVVNDVFYPELPMPWLVEESDS